MHMSVRELQVSTRNRNFQRFDLTKSSRSDAQIGHTDLLEFHRKLSAARNEAEMKSIVDPVAQPNGIMELARLILEALNLNFANTHMLCASCCLR